MILNPTPAHKNIGVEHFICLLFIFGKHAKNIYNRNLMRKFNFDTFDGPRFMSKNS
jgi:hypothetical protein